MLAKAWPVAVAAIVASLCGCGPKPDPGTVNESMTQSVAPTAQAIWNITNAAYNTAGDGLDPSKLSSADWAGLEAAGGRLRDAALALAKAQHVAVTREGRAIMGEEGAGVPSKRGRAWEAVTAKQVQAWIDANPALFAQRAEALAESGKTLIQASRAKDVPTLFAVSSGLDDVCDGCHQRFWGTDEPPPFPE